MKPVFRFEFTRLKQKPVLVHRKAEKFLNTTPEDNQNRLRLSAGVKHPVRM